MEMNATNTFVAMHLTQNMPLLTEPGWRSGRAVVYSHGAPNGAFPKPNSTENSEELRTGAQDLGNECFAPHIPRFGRFPPSAALRLIQEATGMTSRHEQ